MDTTQFETLDQMAETTAAGLSQAAASASFQLFKDKRFRKLAGFDRLWGLGIIPVSRSV
jgi:hypothetical protein